jgi:hypothetical protein
MAYTGVATDNPTLQSVTMRGPFFANAVTGYTALAGGGQAGAVPMTGDINVVTTVGTAADSVLLPPAAAGREITVTNAAAANSMNVFPFSGDKINALSANAAFAVAAGKTCTFLSAVAGQWYALLSA